MPYAYAARLVTAAALALLACAPAHGQAGAQGGRIRVETQGQDNDRVRLIDDRTQAIVATDRIAGPVRNALVSPDDALVVVRHGRNDGGDGLCAYAITWSVDHATGARVGKVTQALVYAPHDGPLVATLQTVPNGFVLRVRTGRYAPLWNKTFLYRRAHATWYEWPKALRPGNPDDATPTRVATTRGDDPYDAYLRAPDDAAAR